MTVLDEVMERLREKLEADHIVYVSADYIEREVINPMKRMGVKYGERKESE